MKKLKCGQVKRILASFERSDWPETLRDAVQAHLAECRTCSQEQALSELIREALRRTPRHHAPAHFTASVMRRIEELELDARRRERRLPAPVAYRAVLAAAILALLATAGLLYVGHHNNALPQPQFDVAAVPHSDTNLVEQLVLYHEQAAAYEAGLDAGVLLARAGP